MRIAIGYAVALWLLAATGCGEPCGGCKEFETCEHAQMTCALNVATRFDVLAASGSVSNSGRSTADGTPNPQVCVALAPANDLHCSSVQSSTYSPNWQEALLIDVEGEALVSQPLTIRYVDKELLHDVTICSGSVIIDERWLHDGAFRFTCDDGSYVRFHLNNIDHGLPSGEDAAVPGVDAMRPDGDTSD